MTTKQYDLLIQYASDFHSAVLAYEEIHGSIDLNSDPVSEIVVSGTNRMRLINDLKPIFPFINNPSNDGEPF